MSLTDVSQKRTTMNTKIQAYRDAVAANDGTAATKLSEAQAAGKDFTDAVSAAKKQDSTLNDVDFFSNPALLTQTRIDVARAELLAAGVAILEDEFDGTVLNSELWSVYDPTTEGYVSLSGGLLTIWADGRTLTGGTDPTVGIASKALVPVKSSIEVRSKAEYSYGSNSLIGLFPANAKWYTGALSDTSLGLSWHTNGLDTTYIHYRDETGKQGSVNIPMNTGQYVTYKMVRVDANTIEFYAGDTLMHTLTGVTFANDYQLRLMVDPDNNFNRSIIDWVKVLKL